MNKNTTVPDTEKVAGCLQKNVFVIHKDYEIEFFRIFNGWGMNKRVLEHQYYNNVGLIRIVCHKKGGITEIHEVTPGTWLAAGQLYKNPVYPYDFQLILSIGNFEVKQ